MKDCNKNCKSCQDRELCKSLKADIISYGTENEEESVKKVSSQNIKKISLLVTAVPVILICQVVVSFIVQLITYENFANVTFATAITILFFTILYIVNLFLLGEYSVHFRKSAVFYIVSVVVSLSSGFIGKEETGGLVISLIILLINIILQTLSLCEMWQGMEQISSDIDDNLSDKWLSLRQWYVLVVKVLFVCCVLLFVPLLNKLLVIPLVAVAGGIIVLGVWNFVLLFKTAGLFLNMNKISEDIEKSR